MGWRYFNPRTPVGCDLRHSVVDEDVAISIHAPQWGATRISGIRSGINRDFNPRTPVGCDWPWNWASPSRCYFNPRTPVGCDLMTNGPSSGPLTFQSTHPSGVRPTPRRRRCVPFLFQSTHPSGVRQQRLPRCDHIGRISIHAPQWGATP